MERIGKLLFVLGLTAAPISALAQVVTQNDFVITVDAARQIPVLTGISVQAGRTLTFTASGTWCMGGTPPTAECGPPSGIRPANAEELPLILDTAQIGTLIGRVASGPWFKIGAGGSIKMPNSGTLALLFNDRPCCFGDNSGSVTVKMKLATERMSVSSRGSQGNGNSSGSSISRYGHYVAFGSDATNLVPRDTNGSRDIFFHNRETGVTRRVSVSSSGNQANSFSLESAISEDGQYVAFSSYASNLVPGDANGSADIFVHNRSTGVTRRVSVSTGGGQSDSGSSQPAISPNGRYVAFESTASNLVPGDTNGEPDIFVHDRATGVTQRVSVSSSGEQGDGDSQSPAISSNGRYVAFISFSTNLVPNDSNEFSYDVFVHDRVAGTTQRVSVNSSGSEGNASSSEPSISADGRYVAFQSNAGNLVADDTNGATDIFLHDRTTGITSRMSVNSTGQQGNSSSGDPAISADGRAVTFSSAASNLVSGDTNGKADVFVHGRETGITRRVSLASGGTQGNNHSVFPAISSYGRYITFSSEATNLVPGDTNSVIDVFVRDRGP